MIAIEPVTPLPLPEQWLKVDQSKLVNPTWFQMPASMMPLRSGIRLLKTWTNVWPYLRSKRLPDSMQKPCQSNNNLTMLFYTNSTFQFHIYAFTYLHSFGCNRYHAFIHFNIHFQHSADLHYSLFSFIKVYPCLREINIIHTYIHTFLWVQRTNVHSRKQIWIILDIIIKLKWIVKFYYPCAILFLVL